MRKVGLLAERGVFVIGLERHLDVFGVVAEVKDEGLLLAWRRAIQARKRLNRLDAIQPFVDVHGVAQRLVESGLGLVADQPDAVLCSLVAARAFRFPAAVPLCLCALFAG